MNEVDMRLIATETNGWSITHIDINLSLNGRARRQRRPTRLRESQS